MYIGGFTAEVTSLSPQATENDVCDFFALCGEIQHVEIIRYGEYSSTAYITFTEPYSLETALLLDGAQILDQTVSISRWGAYADEDNSWHDSSQRSEGNSSYTVNHANQFASSPKEAVTVAQEVVKTMLAKGYVLGKDTLVKAKALDESHKFSSAAANKIAEFSHRIGLTDNIYSSMETVRYVDEKYHVSDFTKSAVLVTGTAAVAAVTITGKAAAAATTAVINSNYFAKGALWVSDALSRAAKAAADLGRK